jgi:hypothetical protein
MQQVVSGHPQILRGGVVLPQTGDLCTARHPRTAAGLSRDRQTLYLMVVDGRSTSSIGMTCAEEARFLAELGAWDAINLDGGGSSAMWVRGVGVVNSPSDGAQRVVANHLAVQAAGSGHAESCQPWEPYEAASMAQVVDGSTTTDIDGDGLADSCIRTAAGIRCHLSSEGAFDGSAIVGPGLADDNGWSDVTNHRTIAFGDVTGDGRADLCARANAGIRCWASTGDGFATESIVGPALSDDDGWNALDRYGTLRLADVDGDYKADLCARAADGFRCWPATVDGFGEAWPPVTALSDEEGFVDESRWSTIRMGDVDGDGLADVCARGLDGLSCYRSTGTGFEMTPIEGPRWSDDNGWSQASNYLTLRLDDVDGDGRADVCARANGGFRCHLSEGGGFGPAIALDAMTNDSGWSAYQYYSTIRLADIDGDGDRDVCARAARGIVCWPFLGDTWGELIDGPELSNAEGWGRAAYYRTIRFADFDGDGDDDLCARSSAGLWCWPSEAGAFGARIDGPAWGDAAGFLDPRYHTTLRLAGPLRAPTSPALPGMADAGSPMGEDAAMPSHGSDADTSGAPDGGLPSTVNGGCSATDRDLDGAPPIAVLVLLVLVSVRRGRS